jgi:hypothetical protein
VGVCRPLLHLAIIPALSCPYIHAATYRREDVLRFQWVLTRAASTRSNYWSTTVIEILIVFTALQSNYFRVTASVTAHYLGSLSMINKTMSSTCSEASSNWKVTEQGRPKKGQRFAHSSARHLRRWFSAHVKLLCKMQSMNYCKKR